MVEGSARIEHENLRFERASARLAIPKDRPFGLTVEGQPVGAVSGSASLTAARGDDRTTRVDVQIPDLQVDLPKVIKTGVHELEEVENVRVGVYYDRGFRRLPLNRGDSRRAAAPEKDEPRVIFDVHVRRAEVVRGNTLRVTFSGDPTITLANETTLSGQIRLTRGVIDVQGKEFEIQSGMVTFNDDTPPNPVIVAKAAWTANDGTLVIAEFSGTLEDGKLNLRSEPARPQNEILALVLFGTVDGANPTPAPARRGTDGAMSAALSLGGGLAAEGFTEALDDLIGLQARARIDTTLPGNPRPEIEFQLTPRLSVEFSRVIGTPPLFAPDRNMGTLQWHFFRNWSLEATFGDRGTARANALWRKTY